MNKYLEKIAARMSTIEGARRAQDIYQLNSAYKKKKKQKKVKPTAMASRRLNRGPIRKSS